jgi:DNA primase
MTNFDRKALTALQATAERYHGGLTPEVIQYLAGRGINRDVADRFLLGVCDDIHDGWLSIPYLRGDAGVIWFNYRNLSGGKPKYMASGPKHLYNTGDLDLADMTGEIAVCEGEIDTITASALCGIPAVGIPGATQWTGNRSWHELFTGYKRVWVLADPDEPGLSLAAAIMEVLPAARLVRLPGDVNETYLAEGDLKGYLK